MDKSAKIFVAGHRGLVGSALVRSLTAQGYENLAVPDAGGLDLRNGGAVRAFFGEEKPDYVFLAAARVGGIMANSTYPVEFLLENLEVQNSVIGAAHESQVKKLMFLGSSCIYPKMAPQPIHEDYLLSGPLEPTNDAYAIAKIAGIKLCQAYSAEYGDALPFGDADESVRAERQLRPAIVARAAGAAAQIPHGQSDRERRA